MSIGWTTRSAIISDAVENACRHLGLACTELATAYDIDVAADLSQLIADRTTDPCRVPATWAVLQAIGVVIEGQAIPATIRCRDATPPVSSPSPSAPYSPSRP